jgi:hypothetical protein
MRKEKIIISKKLEEIKFKQKAPQSQRIMPTKLKSLF